jgi:hypothetical protein
MTTIEFISFVKKSKQADVIKRYADCLHLSLNWDRIKQAIVNKWSISGFERIRYQAYKLVKNNEN